MYVYFNVTHVANCEKTDIDGNWTINTHLLMFTFFTWTMIGL